MAAKSSRGNPRSRGRIRVRFGVDKLERTAFTMNVSNTGAFVRTNNVYPPGTTLQVEFAFPQRAVTIHARVVWAKKVPPQMSHLLECGMGIRFLNPGEDWIGLFEDWEKGKLKS